MAIVSSIAVGKATGSVGNVTFSTQKGRVIMKEKAVSINDRKSDLQVAQRSRMAATILAFQNVGSVTKAGFTRVLGFGSPYNRFVSLNIVDIDAISPVHLATEVDPLKGLIISDGVLVNPTVSAAVAANKATITANLAILPESQLKVGDKIIFVLYAPEKGATVLKTVVLNQAQVTVKSVAQVIDNVTLSVGLKYGYSAYYSSADGSVSSTAKLQEIAG